jgi:hypothetical protein
LAYKSLFSLTAVVVLGFDYSERDVGLVVEDVIGAL